MTDVRRLYHREILRLDRCPDNEGELEAPTHQAECDNPLCGDRVRLHLIIKEGQIEQARFTGRGCALSRASASLMTTRVTGLHPSAARELAEALARWMNDRSEAPAGFELFEGVLDFKSRISCVQLPWEALLEALRHPDGGPDRSRFCRTWR